MTTHKRSFRKYISGIFSAVATPAQPVRDEQRDELLASLRSSLELEEQATWQEREQQINEEPDPALRSVLRANLHYNKGHQSADIDRTIESVSAYSVSTLQMLHDAFHETKKVKAFLGSAPKDEAGIRSALAFGDLVTADRLLTSVVNDVRHSTGIDDFSELAPGTTSYDLAAAVVRVAVGAAENRLNTYFRQYKNGVMPTREERLSIEKWLKQERENCKMTPALALVIVDCPKRAADIISYIDSRDGDIENIDAEHLRVYLDNESIALSAGVL